MSLQAYQRKRDFDQTPEPAGEVVDTGWRRFVVQEHHASRLHFDFRLEMGGVLKSWAIPKGPSLDPADKRLAVSVEDHPVSYIDFEGHIAEGNYGAGEVVVWDKGHYEAIDPADPLQAIAAGKLRLRLHGATLRGEFSLFKLSGRKDQWLLVKTKDREARKGWKLNTLLEDDKPAPVARRGPARKQRRPAAPKKTSRASPQPYGHDTPVPGAVAASMPDVLEPMLATLVDRPFDDPDWLFETKWDGVRTLAYLDEGQVRLVSRNHKAMAFRYPELAGLAEGVRAAQAVLDGEIVSLDDEGHASFQRLQARMGLQDPAEIERLAAERPVVFMAFDLLYCDGYDLRAGALVDRQALLRSRLAAGDRLHLSQPLDASGERAYRVAREQGVEGLIAKRKDSPYQSGRSGDWLKIKTVQRQELVVGGFTAPRRSRPLFGALVTGYYQDGKLLYAGHVGGGLSHADLDHLHGLLAPLKTSKPPFADPPSTNEVVTWVEPRLVVEVKFAEWTSDGCLRQPIFLGLRDDKDPRQVRREQAQPAEVEVKQAEAKAAPEVVAGQETAVPARKAFAASKALAGTVRVVAGRHEVTLTHADKVYWPDEGLTKTDLARYYWQVSDVLLPYVKDRPMILKRYPNGIARPSFFQHDVGDVPRFVRTTQAEAENGRVIDYVVCDNVATLLYLSNLGNIALNPWHSRLRRLDKPDWVVFDLDPKEAEFKTICAVAMALKDVLDRLGLAAFPKTSGSRGLHVYVPIRIGPSYDQTAALAQRVAEVVAAENPVIATVARSLRQRPAHSVYVDHLQNARGKSMVAPYAVRARPGATVSAPLTWREVTQCADPAEFTLETLPRRLKRRGDLFAPVLNEKQGLERALARLEKL
jgi:bifunctional non-homologous end joining protein LigD